MRTEVLTYLIEADKEQSFSKAANNLFVSKSTLSESISLLELELNVRIFNREKKHFETTAKGKKIIEQAKKILAEVDELYTISFNSPSFIDYSDSIKFGLTPKFAQAGLNECLSLILKKYPNISIQTTFFNYNDCIDAINQSKLDFGMIAFSQDKRSEILNLCSSFKLTCVPLMNDPIICLISKKSSLSNKVSLSVKDLKGHTIISYNNIFPDSIISDSQQILLFSNIDNILQLINDNVGISLLPLSLLKSQAYLNEWTNIKSIPLMDSMQYNCIVHSSEKNLTAIQKYLINIYRHAFQKIIEQ